MRTAPFSVRIQDPFIPRIFCLLPSISLSPFPINLLFHGLLKFVLRYISYITPMPIFPALFYDKLCTVSDIEFVHTIICQSPSTNLIYFAKILHREEFRHPRRNYFNCFKSHKSTSECNTWENHFGYTKSVNVQ